MKYRSLFFNAVLALCIVSLSAYSAGPRIMEKLGRSLVVANAGSATKYLSWRLFGPEQGSDIAFNVYKGGTKLNATPITTSTNYVDNSSGTGDYTLKVMTGGIEGSDAIKPAMVLQSNYLEIPLMAAPGKNIKFGQVGDLDGDGEYEYVVDNQAINVSQYLDAYHRDGRHLWRIDMGPNSMPTSDSRPGAACISFGHSDNWAVYDIDCDGKAELIVKAGNGTIFGDNKVLNASTNPTDAFIVAVDGVTGAEKGKRCAVPNDHPTMGNPTGHFGIAYFDGVHPTLMFKGKWGGTQAMADMAFDCSKSCSLSLRWKALDDPISDYPNNHQIRCLDVNGDGIDEFVNGGYCRDKDGKVLWNQKSQGILHGDRWHITDMDPSRPGLEGFGIGQFCTYDWYYYDAKTGEVLRKFGPGGRDMSRGDVGDVDPAQKGYECWTSDGVFNNANLTGSAIGSGSPSVGYRIWWDGDLLSEQANATSVSKWSYPGMPSGGFSGVTLAGHVTGSGYMTPLICDMFGDWREELLIEQTGNTAMRIYTTTIPTEHRIYTLLHNPQYRNAMIERGYIQSKFVDYFLGEGMAEPPKPNMTYPDGIVPVVPDIRRTGRTLASSAGTTMMVMAGKSFTLPGVSAEARRMISVYTCSGKLVARLPVGGNNVDLEKQFGLSNSMFVIKLDHAGKL
jgi:rhamnogalacturonan endolyase